MQLHAFFVCCLSGVEGQLFKAEACFGSEHVVQLGIMFGSVLKRRQAFWRLPTAVLLFSSLKLSSSLSLCGRNELRR